MNRWLSVSALVYAGWVVYACTLGLAMRALDPDVAEFGPAQFFVVGSVTAALFAPMTGFFIVRAINRSVRWPGDDARWWWRAHRVTIQMMAIMTVIAGVGAGIGWATGSASSGLFLGSCFGAVLTAAPKSATCESWEA